MRLVRCTRPPRAGTVDVIEIDAASHGGVDDARDLRERASYGPAQSRYKVYIIDEADMVTPQGFNALLKIVEEPPEHMKFSSRPPSRRRSSNDPVEDPPLPVPARPARPADGVHGGPLPARRRLGGSGRAGVRGPGGGGSVA